ncbi:MAG: NAD(P)H-dependent oxidoreductase subunit E [Lachnospiraceae bacterium]|nr:NAD(P)H-dependent oxidoreductase subunit E [Lachnospiraceae bacterium]
MEQKFGELTEWFRDNYDECDQEGIKELLRRTQEAYGCVPAAVKEQLIEELGLSKGIVQILIRQLPGISEVSFDHQITVCNNTHCMANGAADIIEALKDRLGLSQVGEVTADGRYRLTTRKCFKKCKSGPNVMVDDVLYSQMSPDRLNELFK